MPGRVLLGMVLLLGLSSFAASAWAGPSNLRQTEEGYWLSAEPTAEDAAALDALGIKVILSLSPLTKEARLALRAVGLKIVNSRFGRHFPEQERMQAAFDYLPEETLIHCLHGGDRTGAVLAYLLVIRHGWRADLAALTVLMPTQRERSRGLDILEELGYSPSSEEVDSHLGVYSGKSTGGVGGLKLLNKDYKSLFRELIKAMEADPLVASPGPLFVVQPGSHQVDDCVHGMRRAW